MNFYETNIQILKNIFPGFENEILKKYRPSEELKISTDTNGVVSATIGGRGLCSRHNPVREAEKIIDAEIDRGTQCCVFGGFGLGYEIEAFLKIIPEGLAIVADPDPSLFLAAMKARDFSSLFLSGQIWILFGENPETVIPALKKAEGKKIRYHINRTLKERDPGYYEGFKLHVTNFITRREININTLKRFGKRWVKNLGANIKQLPLGIGISSLNGKFGEFPALIIAAGPTMDEVLPLLPELRKRMLLICVDTSLRRVLDTGIDPDFTVVVDPQYWNSRHLDRACPEKSLLITDSSTYPSVFRHFRPPYVYCQSPFPLSRYIENKIGLTGKLKAGGSVATAGWEIARYFGCSAVYCAGLDLGFPDRKTHFRGSYFEERIHVISQRISPAETAAWHALNDAGPYPVPDRRNGEILTDKRLAIYRSWFQEKFKYFPDIRTYLLSGKGSYIEGGINSEPEDLLSLPETRNKIDAILIQIKTGIPLLNETDKLKMTLSEIINDLEYISKIAEQGKSVTRAVQRSIKTGKDIRPQLRQLDEIDKCLLNSAGKEITSFILQPLIYRINWKEDNGQTTPDSILAESEEIYESMENAALFQINILKSALFA